MSLDATKTDTPTHQQAPLSPGEQEHTEFLANAAEATSGGADLPGAPKKNRTFLYVVLGVVLFSALGAGGLVLFIQQQQKVEPNWPVASDQQPEESEEQGDTGRSTLVDRLNKRRAAANEGQVNTGMASGQSAGHAAEVSGTTGVEPPRTDADTEFSGESAASNNVVRDAVDLRSLSQQVIALQEVVAAVPDLKRRLSQLQEEGERRDRAIIRAYSASTATQQSLTPLLSDMRTLKAEVGKSDLPAEVTKKLDSMASRLGKITKNMGYHHNRLCRAEAVTMGTIKSSCKGVVPKDLLAKHDAINRAVVGEPDMAMALTRQAQPKQEPILPTSPSTQRMIPATSSVPVASNNFRQQSGRPLSQQRYPATPGYNYPQTMATYQPAPSRPCDYADPNWRADSVTATRGWITSAEGHELPVQLHSDIPGLGKATYFNNTRPPHYIQFSDAIVCERR